MKKHYTFNIFFINIGSIKIIRYYKNFSYSVDELEMHSIWIVQNKFITKYIVFEEKVMLKQSNKQTAKLSKIVDNYQTLTDIAVISKT